MQGGSTLRVFQTRPAICIAGQNGLLLRSGAARPTTIACPFDDPHAIVTLFQPPDSLAVHWTGGAFGLSYSGFMANNGNPITDLESADSKLVSFADAARSLGLDLFTFHSIVQREEIPISFTAWGEFAVSQETLNKLATAKE